MKYYCIERDTCGFYHHQPEYLPGAPELCPLCYSPILKYEDSYTPSFVAAQQFSTAPYVADWVGEKSNGPPER